MQRFFLFLCVASAACQDSSYEPGLDPKKTYEYRYEGSITVGRGMPDLAEAGVKLTCSVKIIGVSAGTFLLQISSPNFEEYNGVPGKSGFNASPKLTQRLKAELTKPLMFEYVKGRIGNIGAAFEVSDTVVNIVRGIIGFLQVTVKTTQNVYELEELGIHGICQSAYTIQEDVNSKEFYVTQIVDISKCREMAAIYRGMALTVENENCKERGSNAVATVKYTYTVRSTENGGLITKAHAQEQQQISPFNVKGGTSKLNAIKTIVLLSVTDTVENIIMGPMQIRGNLMYKFGNELNQIPLQLKKLDNPTGKISALIQNLAEVNMYQIDSFTSEDIFDLYQLLRVSTLENLEDLWKTHSENAEHRRWLLDTVAEVTDGRVIKFLQNRFQAGDITANEATQALLLALNHLTADSDTVEMSMEFLAMKFTKSDVLLWRTAVLSYGSLVYRYCSSTEPCPGTAVQPLLDLAADSLTNSNEDEMVLVLKGLGNAGHPSSIKTILKFLPGVSAETLPTRVLSAAVQSLRHIAIRDPHSVQDIAVDLFMQGNLPPEVRMLACQILFETKPSLALVSAITGALLEESNMQVASFSYSLIQGFARSKTPDNHHLSTACNVAIKILSPKLGRLAYHYSKALHIDLFNDDFLSGTSADIYMFKNGMSSISTSFISRWKAYFIGRILQVAEVGVHAEQIQEILNQILPFNISKTNINYMEAVLKMLSDLQSLPKDKPLLSAFARIFGQEVFFADVNRDMIHSVMQELNPKAGKDSSIWRMMENLQKGTTWHWTKPYLVFEARYIQATTLGLPAEISKYFSVLTGITINAKTTMSPPPTDNLGQLLNSDITLETDGSVSYTKDYFVFHGINTDIVQSGAELKGKMIFRMPWKYEMQMNLKEKKFQIDVSPSKTDTEFFSVNFNLYAVSRNIEDPTVAKMTPMRSGENSQYFDEASSDSIQNQMGDWSESYHPLTKMCATANVYGMAVCMEIEAERQHYLSEYPLSYFMGYSKFALKLENVPTNIAIDKIHIEINAGTNKAIQKFVLGQSKMLDLVPEPVLTLLVSAISGNAKPNGYEMAAYFTQDSQKDDIQLLVSEVGEEANWKLCTDMSVDRIQSRSKINFKWGAECQTYKISVTAETLQMPNPTLHSKIQWKDVPESMKVIVERVKEYIPGMAFLLGFSQKREKNPTHQMSAFVASATPQGLNMKMEIPELTVYGQAREYPLQTFFLTESYPETEGFKALPIDTVGMRKALCSVSGHNFNTFNNIRFTTAMPKDCFLMLTQDCTPDLKFQVLIKEGITDVKEIYIKTPAGSIIINTGSSGMLLKLNDSQILLSTLPLKDTSGQLLINKSDDGIVVQAPKLGLSSLYFNGKTLKVVIESWMRGKTCGLCGKADGGNTTVFTKPNSKTALSPIGFLSSWMLQGIDCMDSCNLRHQLVKLEKVSSTLGNQLICHSVEPMLRCREGCFPIESVHHSVGFTCAILGTAVNQSESLTPRPTLDQNTVYMEEMVDTHTSCLCRKNLCPAA